MRMAILQYQGSKKMQHQKHKVMQIPLNIRLPDSATFANLISGRNRETISHLQHYLQQPSEQALYLWAGTGCGKSHCLQAACHQRREQGLASIYLPLLQAHELSPSMLDDCEQLSLVCVDDIQAIAGNRDWEEALFHLYNRMQLSSAQLVVTGNTAPSSLPLVLQDLVSRLSWGWVFQLHQLNDQEKMRALQLRAHNRGITMTDDVADYLLRHYPRDMHALFAMLDQLDKATLIEQRKLTIPFIKRLMADS